MAEDEMQSIPELRANLAEYRNDLAQVEQLLASEPGNAEHMELQTQLKEVIELTEEMLNDAIAADPAAGAAAAAPPPPPPPPQLAPLAAPIAIAPNLAPGVAAQLQQALASRGIFTKGMAVTALYREDGQWYDAVVKEAREGQYVVTYSEYGTDGVVSLNEVRKSEVEEIYQGVPAPKRVKTADGSAVPKEIPKKLEILPTDDDKTKEKKRKAIKSLKSKMRFAELEEKHDSQKNSWQSFIGGKGSKKKKGFFTGTKKESMFKSTETGKVGVVGGGRGMTEFKGQKKEVGKGTVPHAAGL